MPPCFTYIAPHYLDSGAYIKIMALFKRLSYEEKNWSHEHQNNKKWFDFHFQKCSNGMWSSQLYSEQENGPDNLRV